MNKMEKKLEMMANITSAIHAFGVAEIIDTFAHVQDNNASAEIFTCIMMWDHEQWVRSLPRCPSDLSVDEPKPLYQIPEYDDPGKYMVIGVNKWMAFTIPLLTLSDLSAQRKQREADMVDLFKSLQPTGPPPRHAEETLLNGEHTSSSSGNSYAPVISEACIGQPHFAPIAWQRCVANRESVGLPLRLLRKLRRRLLPVLELVYFYLCVGIQTLRRWFRS